jgi:acetyltransferase-like isoleucine patch superfamily enzyme
MSEQFLIYPNVHWDPVSSHLDPFVILGRPPRQRQPGELPLYLGDNATLRSGTVIYAGTRIGTGLQTGHGAMIREDNELGDQVSVGTHAVLEYGNRIGHRVRIHSNCFLERVILEDDVFLGPQVVFTDDLHPICPRYQECRPPARIGRYTRIGANTTLLPGVQIGENCLIGAGSVVTTHIPAHHVAVGNPARIVRRIEDLSCEAGFFSRPYAWLEDEP